MQDALGSAKPWLTFGGSILVVAVLYWTQAVVVPFALAVLLTFLLAPPVSRLQRSIGRVPGVLVVVLLTFTVLALAGWGLTQQVTSLVQELPGYRQNVREKIRDVRQASRGGSVETLQDTVEAIEAEINEGETRGTSAQPVVVSSEQVSSLWGLPTAIGPWLEPFATAGLVVALVLFMLLERQELRNRLISLFSQGQLAVTTRALDEAGDRVSRYLMSQSLISVAYGVGVGAGLYFLGVPYFILWAALAAALRFIPYVGPWIAAVAPILISLAALEGWTRPLLVAGLFLAFELFTNLVVEGYFYAGAAGVSQVGLLTAVAFWTWLWGPLGLLMATPLTVCLVVVGKYVPGLEFITKLMSDEDTLDADAAFYQRLLAGDEAEAAELLEQHVQTEAADSLYDKLILPALNYAERDRTARRLSLEEEHAVVKGARELLDDAERLMIESGGVIPEDDNGGERALSAEPIEVLGWPAHGEADELALRLFAQLLDRSPFTLEILTTPTLVSEVVRAVLEHGCPAVCIADLPPSRPSRSRYLVKRLRAAAPDLKILVGRWAPPSLADENVEALREAGANYVGSTLLETRAELYRVLDVAMPATRDPSPSAAKSVMKL